MPRLPVSCFIIALNEGDRIARTIRSVEPWVSEVIVVDSGSTDDTISVALAEGARVVEQAWLGFGGQKRFAEEQCRHDWVFNLDADEVVSPNLRTAIVQLLSSGVPEYIAYGMPINIVYPGQTKPRLWARDNWYVRLYNRSYVRFRDSGIHDTVVTDGHTIGRIEAPIYHFSVRSLDHLRTKLDERMSLSAEHTSIRSRALMFGRLVVEFPINFYKYYFVRRHFTGGLIGLQYAVTHSLFRLKKVYRLCQKQSPQSRTPTQPPYNNDEVA